MDDPKQDLIRYLSTRRDDLVATLDGLDDYTVRRPLTPTGTNLLGLVKHVAAVQLDYLGEVFERPAGIPQPWLPEEGGADDDDLWANAEETRADILELFRLSSAHADETIAALPLDAVGEVPWWPEESRRVTLHRVLVHLIVEVARHAGHADILREGLDGRAGQRPGDANVPTRDADAWAAYRERIESAARRATA